ncbi:hypothetical protein Tsubulata_027568 [Turnera subulata]|uniref:Uncharacterized protein n=1 Tax=Turnera subulata TaxID=218843 RepID=A0A9Q0FYF8_9ROSI|nr:hypothetical protein Tsubulata_027568 [Turnera subulata]
MAYVQEEYRRLNDYLQTLKNYNPRSSVLMYDLRIPQGLGNGWTYISDQHKWRKANRREALQVHFWKCVKAITPQELAQLVSEFSDISKQAKQHFLDASPKQWCRAYQKTRCKSDVVDNNMCAINPIPGQIFWDECGHPVVHPPDVDPKRGRPQTQTRKEEGEKGGSQAHGLNEAVPDVLESNNLRRTRSRIEVVDPEAADLSLPGSLLTCSINASGTPPEGTTTTTTDVQTRADDENSRKRKHSRHPSREGVGSNGTVSRASRRTKQLAGHASALGASIPQQASPGTTVASVTGCSRILRELSNADEESPPAAIASVTRRLLGESTDTDSQGIGNPQSQQPSRVASVTRSSQLRRGSTARTTEETAHIPPSGAAPVTRSSRLRMRQEPTTTATETHETTANPCADEAPAEPHREPNGNATDPLPSSEFESGTRYQRIIKVPNNLRQT